MRICFFFLVVNLLFSCSEKKKDFISSHQPKVVEAKGYVVPKDSMAEPKVVLVDESKLKKIPAGKPKIVPTNLNVHQVPEKLTVIEIDESKLRTITPGTDTFSLPKTVPAIDSPFIAPYPKPVTALPLRMKDAAICNIQYLDVDQGMNSSYVFSILEDKNGNLWFGSYGGGVSKYDGKSFTHYTDKEGLSSNTVLSMLEDKSGNIWFCTSGGGVSKYDGKYFTHFTEKQGLSNNTVLSVLEDKKGNLWFGTDGGGLCKYDGKFFTRFTEDQGLSYNTIWSIFEDKSGNLWFGTDGRGVNKYDGKSFTRFTDKEGLSNNTILSILEDKSGIFWFGTDGGGLCKYDGKSFTNYTDKEGLSNNTIRSILEDKSGNLWLCTDGGGICKYDGNFFTHYTEREGLSNNTVSSIMEDKSGNLWLGTYGGGVCKYDSKSFIHFTDKEGLSDNNAWSILEDKSGNLWFGTDGGGVSKYNGKSFTHYTSKEGLGNNSVWSILQDSSGNFWFGTYTGGVSRFDGKYFTHFTGNDGFSNNTVLSIIEDNSGNLWFGTDGRGAIKYNGKSFAHYTKKEGLSNDTIRQILEDKSGNLWFGTYGGGVCKYDGKSFTHYTVSDGFSNNTVLSMLEDKSGNLWFGTYGGGVCKYNVESFTNYTKKEGLSDNTVWSIIEDKSGNLWLGTEKGLNCFVMSKDGVNATQQLNDGNPRSKQINPQIVVFHKEDGLKAEDFFQNSVLLDSKNRIWWGCGQALSMLDLNEFKLNEKEPNIQLDNIYLQENFVDYKSVNGLIKDSSAQFGNKELKDIKFSSVARFHNYPVNIELPYNLNHLTIQFSAIDWNAPHQIKYQYKLEELDHDWSNLTLENKADYRNIPFGKYTFKVKAIGSAGKWSKTFDYKFIIHPPWWRTWGAYTLYGVFSIAVVIYIVRWNSKKLRARAIMLKQKVDEATNTIRTQKEQVEEKNREILDSITYAKRIQTAILPPPREVKEILKNSFILYLPKDIVAGDFYWMDTIQLADESISGLADELMNKSDEELINGLADEANRQSADEKMSRLANQQNTNQLINQSSNQLINQSSNQLINQSSNQLINQPSNQLINQSANQLIYIAACDCTGHGVPGAMVSVVCNNALNRSLNEFGKRLPGEIFDKTRELVSENFAKSDEEVKDGMDASLCAINLDNRLLMWSGANNPLWIYRKKDNAIEEIKADKQSIGKGYDNKPFTTHHIQLEDGDIIYLFTDGYADQFGGEKMKKLTKAKFREFILSIVNFSMENQSKALLEFHDNYRGNEEQVDDICVIGVRV